MLLLPVVLLAAALLCRAAGFEIFPGIVGRSNSSYLDTMSSNQRGLFVYAMEGLDANFAPPFIVSCTFFLLVTPKFHRQLSLIHQDTRRGTQLDCWRGMKATMWPSPIRSSGMCRSAFANHHCMLLIFCSVSQLRYSHLHFLSRNL